MSATSADALEVARGAIERHAWQEAYDLLTEADRAGRLGGEGLHLLAEAAYFSARPDAAVDAFERSFAAYARDGDEPASAMAAFLVAEQHAMRGSLPQAQGWAGRAMHLADGHPDWQVQAYLEWLQGILSWFGGDFETAIGHCERAAEMARAIGDRNLLGKCLHDKGHALCLMGRVSEGMALLDEAMTSVIAGELDPESAGYIYCGMIGACSRLGDYGRAAEWTEATLRWAERESVPSVGGICRIHRAELLRVRGSFREAEEEARLACDELPQFNFNSEVGLAHYEIGEVRLRLGDLAGAEESFERSNEFGHVPQPGLSLLRVAQGRTEAAAAGIRQALTEVGSNRCAQIRLLAAQTKVALAGGDLHTARTAAEQLGSIIGEFEAASLRATASAAMGAVLLAEGDAAGALPELRRAKEAWERTGAPYDVAELRVLLARAHRALGDDDSATMEARSARQAFERLGAARAAEAAADLVRELAPEPGGERVTRAFMFTDIVKSTDLVGAIGDEAWEGLLQWHDQTLQALFAAHGGQVPHGTGDGFFVAFDDARAALRCAVAIQRALAEHRRAHGFAPKVRIGVHVAEATRRGRDYSGGEVHRAARISALADGDQILVSIPTLEAAGSEFTASERRSATLKGFAQPFEVALLEWR
jgi:class 3 adenylate cyclase